MQQTAINIASHLPEMAKRQPDALAVVVQGARDNSGNYAYTRITAKELDEESNKVANGLQRIGISPGTRTVLMVTPGVEFFVLTFALFKAGAIPVMVDPGMGVKNLKTCLAEAEPEAFIGITKAHAARVLLGWARATNRINVTVGPKLFWGGHHYRDLAQGDSSPIMVETKPGDMAAILFTSGSTGVPKGAVYTHANFGAQIDCLRDDYGVEPGERDLATFPLFALFGPALGMAAIVPDMDASKPITADPRNIIAAIHDFEATNLFASPALIDKVGRYAAAHDIKLPSLKRVISAGAPAEAESLERFSTLLADGVHVFPSYGATEALPVTKIDSAELIGETAALTDTGAGVCVGRPVNGVEVRIIRITDDPLDGWDDDFELAHGQIGEICVKGPVVSEAYYAREQSTRLAKIADPADGGLWHRMGDLGYFDDTGRLWFCGRKAHRVETRDGTLFTVPCERIFNTHPKVRRTALVGVARNGLTFPLLCVELEKNERGTHIEVLKRELAEIGERYDRTRGIHAILIHPGFPVDVRHNAKIFRERLADWAQEKLS